MGRYTTSAMSSDSQSPWPRWVRISRRSIVTSMIRWSPLEELGSEPVDRIRPATTLDQLQRAELAESVVEATADSRVASLLGQRSLVEPVLAGVPQRLQ